jgi:hypothetical protein
MSASILSFVCILVVCAFLARRFARKPRQLPLPPGPPADPMIGHLRSLPREDTRAVVFHNWLQQYGKYHEPS